MPNVSEFSAMAASGSSNGFLAMIFKSLERVFVENSSSDREYSPYWA
jgi:hypothetical protein